MGVFGTSSGLAKIKPKRIIDRTRRRNDRRVCHGRGRSLLHSAGLRRHWSSLHPNAHLHPSKRDSKHIDFLWCYRSDIPSGPIATDHVVPSMVVVGSRLPRLLTALPAPAKPFGRTRPYARYDSARPGARFHRLRTVFLATFGMEIPSPLTPLIAPVRASAGIPSVHTGDLGCLSIGLLDPAIHPILKAAILPLPSGAIATVPLS